MKKYLGLFFLVLAGANGAFAQRGTVNSCPQYIIGEYPNSGSNPIIGCSNLSTDSSGNDLSVPGSLTVNGNVSASSLNNIVYVDGVRYPSTMAGIQSAASSLGPNGGTVMIPCGTYQGTQTIVTTVPTIFQGVSNQCVNIQLTTTGSLLQGIVCKASCAVKDVEISTLTAPTSDLGMFAVRLDTPNNGNLAAAVCDFERDIVAGFNGGLYCDGRGTDLEANEVEQLIMRDNLVAITGCGASGSNVCEPIDAYGAHSAIIEGNLLNNNFVGDHGVYAIQDLSLTVDNNYIENTAGEASEAVKVENGNGSQEYYKWEVSGNTFVNVAMVAIFSPVNSDEVDNIIFSNNTAKTITDTTAGNWAVWIAPGGTSTIDNVTISGNNMENIKRGGYLFAPGTGATIKQVTFSGANLVRNFSQTSPGADYAIGSSSTGTVQNVVIDQFWADGTGTGKAAYGFGASAQRINTFDLTESNVTGTDSPAAALHGTVVVADNGRACSNSELVLSTGWGTSPSVTNVSGTGQTCEWTITSGSGTPTANPTIADTLTNPLPSSSTICRASLIVTATPAAIPIDETTISATAPVFTSYLTPARGTAYKFSRTCGP